MKDTTYKMARLMLVMAIALMLVTGLFLYVDRATADAPYQPGHTVQSYARYTLITANGITTTAAGTGTGVRIAGYDYADCFAAIDIASAQTVTLGFQGSADGTNYAPIVTLTAVAGDTTIMTRTAVIGDYFRPVISLTYANPVTVSVKCVMKN